MLEAGAAAGPGLLPLQLTCRYCDMYTYLYVYGDIDTDVGSDWHSPTDVGFSTLGTDGNGNNLVVPSSLRSRLDQIGSEGAIFTRAYTACGMCAPSRLALLTGRFASRGEYAIYKDGSSEPAKVKYRTAFYTVQHWH